MKKLQSKSISFPLIDQKIVDLKLNKSQQEEEKKNINKKPNHKRLNEK